MQGTQLGQIKNSKTDILVFSKAEKLINKNQIINVNQSLLIEIVSHSVYDCLQTNICVTFPLQLICTINTKSVQVLISLSQQAITYNYLAPGAKILLKQFQLINFQNDCFIKSDNVVFLGGGNYDLIHKQTVENHDNVLNYYIQTKNEQVKKILEKQKNNNSINAYDQIKQVYSQQLQFQFIFTKIDKI